MALCSAYGCRPCITWKVRDSVKKKNGANSKMRVFSTHKGILLCKQILYHNSVMIIRMFRLNTSRIKIYNIFKNSIWNAQWTHCASDVKTSSVILVTKQINAQNLLYNKFVICLYMFRALLCSSAGGQIVLYSIWYRHTCRWPSGVQVERGLDLCTGRPPTGVISDAV